MFVGISLSKIQESSWTIFGFQALEKNILKKIKKVLNVCLIIGAPTWGGGAETQSGATHGT